MNTWKEECVYLLKNLGGHAYLSQIYKEFETNEQLLSALQNKTVNAIVLPRLNYLENILKENMHIAYNIEEYKIN